MPKVIVTFRDNKGKETTRILYTAAGVDHATDQANANSIAGELAALSDAELAKTELVYELQSSTTIPTGNVNHAQVGVFGCRNNAGTLTRVSVPALIDAAVQADNDLLDRGNAQVAAVISRLESGLVEDYRGAALETVEYAREEHTRRG